MPSSENGHHSRRRPKSKRRSSDRGDYASSSTALLLSSWPVDNNNNSSSTTGTTTTATVDTTVAGPEGSFQLQRQHQGAACAGDLGCGVALQPTNNVLVDQKTEPSDVRLSHTNSESSSSSLPAITDNNAASFERCDARGSGSTTTEPEDLSPPSNDARTPQRHEPLRQAQPRSATPKYLLELQNDRWILQTVMQGVSTPFFQHASRLLENEIARVENKLGRELVMTVLSDENDHRRNADSATTKGYFSTTDDRTDIDLIDMEHASSSALVYQSLLINDDFSSSLNQNQESAVVQQTSDGNFDGQSPSPDDLITGKARTSDNAQAVLTLEEKVMLPVSDNPEYNFIGRLMGPRGMTIKRLEQETGCRLLVRGRGSIKNAAREETLRRKPGFEHLNENLHILIQAKDTADTVREKLKCGVDAVQAILKPVDNDELKQKQMRELAIINGTYRPVQNHHRLPILQPPLPVLKPWSLLTPPAVGQRKSKTLSGEDTILNML